MRFADVLGLGKPQLVISPLNKTQGQGVRLTAFAIPDNPRTEAWPRTVLDAELNKMHNHWHVDLDGDKTIDTITASQEGVHWIRRSGDEISQNENRRRTQRREARCRRRGGNQTRKTQIRQAVHHHRRTHARNAPRGVFGTR